MNIHLDLMRGLRESLSFRKEVKPLVLYSVEHGIAVEPMKGKWASSRVDLGHSDLFCIPQVTLVFISSCDGVLGTLWCSIKKIEASSMFGNPRLLCTQCRGIELHLPARRMSHGISQDAAGSWGISSS